MIEGFNQNPNHYDQDTEDLRLFLAHKTAKDFLLKQRKDSFTPADIQSFFSKSSPIAPQLKQP